MSRKTETGICPPVWMDVGSPVKCIRPSIQARRVQIAWSPLGGPFCCEPRPPSPEPACWMPCLARQLGGGARRGRVRTAWHWTRGLPQPGHGRDGPWSTCVIGFRSGPGRDKGVPSGRPSEELVQKEAKRRLIGADPPRCPMLA